MTEELSAESAAAKEIAQEHSKPGTFSFIDRLNNRNYPTETVEIYLDELAGHKIEQLQQQRLAENDPDKALIIDSDIEKWREKARESRYTIYLEGISTEAYDKIVEMAQEQYPLEFRETRNPLTMATEREVIENDDREILFRTHLWAAFIRKIEDTAGNVDTNVTPEFMSVFLGLAPIAAQAAVGNAVGKLRMVTNWMDEIQGEDFFPKS